MQLKLKLAPCPISTYYVRVFLAKVSALQEKDKDLTTPEAQCFLKSYGFSKTKDPDILYSKMLKGYLVMTTDKLSKPYLKSYRPWVLCY